MGAMHQTPLSLRRTMDLDEGERWVTVSGGDLPRPIQIRLGIPKGRSRLAITGVRIGALNNEPEYEITTRMLQRMSLRRLTESIAAGLWGDEDSNLAHAWRGGPPDEYPDAETPAQLLAAKAQTLLVRGGRRGLDEATLRRTVKLYDEARAAGETQLLAVVAQQLDVHPATVWRRLQIAWKRFPELRPMEGKP